MYRLFGKGEKVRIGFVKVVAVLALSIGLLCVGANVAFAATTIKVSPKSGSDAAQVIQEALDKANKKASNKNQYTVKVKPGTYKLGSTLKIRSNTTLDLTAVKLKKIKGNRNMIKVGNAPRDSKKGFAYKNITIIGGNLDNSGTSNTSVVIGHAKNVKLIKVSIHNTKNAHLVEVAGVEGFLVDRCKFYNQKQTKMTGSRTLEALQLDILVKVHMPLYRAEALRTKNVIVRKCTFKNVPRGVGSHTAFLNGHTKDVQILGNKFIGCKNFAIQTRNFLNCTIRGNTITKCSSGIAVESISKEGTYLSSRFSKKYKTPIANQNIEVLDNKIAVKGDDPFYGGENVGIRVSGCELKKKLKKTTQTDAIPKGNYYVSGVTISGNKITTAAHGIRFDDARNSTISDNTISFNGNPKKVKTGFYGIQIFNKSTGNSIINNKVSRFCTNGIFVSTKSSASRIEKNVISNSGKYGIVLLDSSSSVISSNYVSNSGVVGVYVMTNSAVGTISDNTISTVNKGSGISVFDKSKVTEISRNSISSVSDNGVIVQQKSQVGSIVYNSILSAKKYGIYIDAGSIAKSISGNGVSASLKDIVLK